jgi:hypothetical protein
MVWVLFYLVFTLLRQIISWLYCSDERHMNVQKKKDDDDDEDLNDTNYDEVHWDTSLPSRKCTPPPP